MQRLGSHKHSPPDMFRNPSFISLQPAISGVSGCARINPYDSVDCLFIQSKYPLLFCIMIIGNHDTSHQAAVSAATGMHCLRYCRLRCHHHSSCPLGDTEGLSSVDAVILQYDRLLCNHYRCDAVAQVRDIRMPHLDCEAH